MQTHVAIANDVLPTSSFPRVLFLQTVILMLVCLLTIGVSTSAADKKVTITLLYRQDHTGVAEQWIAEFESLYPHIQVEWQQQGGDWQQKLLTEMLAGTAPDVFEFWSPFNHQLRQRELLLNLTPYMLRDFTEEEIADFYPAVWESSFTRFGPHAGSQYIMPRYINLMVFYFNDTHFQESGLANPLDLDAAGNWTWDSFREAAQKLTRSDGAEVVRHGSMVGTSSVPRVLNWVWGAGGDFIDPNDPTRYVGHEDQAVEAVRFLQGMIWEDGIAPPSPSSGNFAQGKSSMLEDGMGEAIDLLARVDNAFDLNVIRRPMGPDGRWGYLVDDSFGIWSDTPHPEEAWLLLKFLVSKRGQEILVEFSGKPPVRRSAAETYFSLHPDYNLAAFADAVMDSRPTIFSRIPGDIRAVYDTLMDILNQSVVTNAMPYESAVEALRPRVEMLLQEESGE